MMRRWLFVFLLLCFGKMEVLSQTVKIWEGTLMERKQKRSEMTVYLPSKNHNTGAAVILCPGGSYCYLGIRHEGHKVAKWLQARGVAAFVLRYRVGMYGNHYPAMIEDLQRTIQLVREGSLKYSIDPGKVGVMGFSAGGHLAGTAGIYYNENFLADLGIHPTVSLRPDFIAMIYPVVSMEDGLAHRKSRRNLLGRNYSLQLAQKMSLEKNVHAGMPPVFLLHCKDDKTVDVRNSEIFGDELKKDGIDYKELIYNKGNHGFGLVPHKSADSHAWPEVFESWMKKTIIGLEKSNIGCLHQK